MTKCYKRHIIVEFNNFIHLSNIIIYLLYIIDLELLLKLDERRREESLLKEEPPLPPLKPRLRD